MYIDEERSGNATPQEEVEANEWASNFLIPESELTRFIIRFTYRDDEVISFAQEQGIAPGIVVGQLQHRKVLRYNQMNHLRERCE
jgi:Zn-dependent peptidase ImmA (M78 family)